MQHLKTAVFGTGFVGRVHLEGIRRLGFVELYAIGEPQVEKAKQLADEFGVPKTEADYHRILDDTAVDAVHVCTPNFMHFPIAKDALLAGKHVICEKPLATSVAEAGRSAGFLAWRRSISRHSGSGISGLTSRMGRGASSQTRRMTATVLAARKAGRNWFFTLVAYGILFTLVTTLLSLPLDYYSGFVRPHAYGLSDQTAAKWWSDQATGLAIGCIGIALLLWIPYLLLRKSPRRWWLYSGLAAFPLLVLILFVTPIWIDPLFNKFGPMKDKALEGKILALADRAGIDGGRIFEVDKSRDTTTVNAYVVGLLGTKRIVLWDTLLAKLNEREVLFVMGHEMGHYVLHHVVWGILGLSVLVLLGLYFVHRAAGVLIRRYRGRLGF